MIAVDPIDPSSQIETSKKLSALSKGRGKTPSRRGQVDPEVGVISEGRRVCWHAAGP